MLKITVVTEEAFDQEKQEFLDVETFELELEHSLVSLSKWEAKWEKPFLSSEEKSVEETLDYIRCMVIGRFDEEVFLKLSSDNITEISNYINAKRSATIIHQEKEGSNKETITSELVYYWMVAHSIPFECETWHFNRLLMLIQVCNIKNQPEKKMSKRETLERNRELNRQRRLQHKTTG